MSNYYRAQAVYATHPTAKHGDGTNYYDENGIVINLDEKKITEKQKEIESLELMRLLREERNLKLQETDWTQYRDVSLSNDSDWQTYRQSLRDLPQNFSPIIDIITEDGYPIVKEQTDWPEKPS